MSDNSSSHNRPRVWLITGCTSGFGKLFVSAIVARGDKVIATARNVSALDEFRDTPNVRLLNLDVTATQDELNATAATALELFGGVDVLVNNAGYVLSGAWEELTHEQVLHQFQTNFFGQMNVTRVFVPHMRCRGSGTIIFMSSIAGWLGVAAGGPYSASKFALEGAAESLQKELSPLGIQVHLAVLGQFRTNILAEGRRQIPRSTPVIDGYNPVIETLTRRQEETNGKQPGDPVRAVERILDVVRREGSVAGKEVGLRIVLGSDAQYIIRDQCLNTLRDLDQFEEFSRSTDFPGAGGVDAYS
ncbi:hypothetical protein ASPCAL13446 [Aspergillus calidoustus]|uniref:Uncharacterized protein n=1 Tax=Aspergillus calidoustus TaxID=454130 RepID=A0A0U4ZL52_ASPCI|nr:hypothetical protein ASPCAL13446 [Aspergillus calidoustus]